MRSAEPERAGNERDGIPGADAAVPDPEEGRRARRRRETRARLLDAAIRLIGEEGLEAATIAEITSAADVGFGTFYSYFSSRDELLVEATRGLLERLARRNDALAAASDDPARAFVVGVRNTLELAERDPGSAAFALSLADAGQRGLWADLARRMRADVRRGLSSGRFRTEEPEVLIEILGGAVLAVMRARVEGRVGPGAGTALAAHALRLLGLDPEEARRIAGEPLPQRAPAPELRG